MPMNKDHRLKPVPPVKLSTDPEVFLKLDLWHRLQPVNCGLLRCIATYAEEQRQQRIQRLEFRCLLRAFSMSSNFLGGAHGFQSSFAWLRCRSQSSYHGA